MKKTRTKLIAVLISVCLLLSVVVLLLFCLTLYGCSKNLRNYFYTEESLKRVAAKALKEKYDEEFVIHDAWTRDQTSFYVTCSPKNDMDVVFEANVYKDGSGVYEDEYLQGVVAKQLNEKYQQEFQQLFKGCFVRSTVRYAKTDLENVSDITIEDYMNQYDIQGAFSFWGLDVFVLLPETSWDTIDAEYKLLSEKIQDEINAGRLPEIVLNIYFVDDETMKWCKEYFKVNSYCYTEFYNAVESYPNIGIGYPTQKINMSYEEYKNLRMEIGTNE